MSVEHLSIDYLAVINQCVSYMQMAEACRHTSNCVLQALDEDRTRHTILCIGQQCEVNYTEA